MIIPKWIVTTLSFVLIALIFMTYVVTHSPSHRALENTRQPDFSSHPSFTHPISIGDRKLSVAYAITPSEEQQGLSDTLPLATDQGMLFLFNKPSVESFWMKDMNYPLDIIWIGSDKKVVAINANLSPLTFPNTFSPQVPISYVLEVSAGFAEKNHVVVGTPLTF